MLFNRLKYLLVFTVLFTAGLVFVATPATANVTPVLSVLDGDENAPDIQVYGIRAETATFGLTITFQDDPTAVTPVNTPVTDFDIEDIKLYPADNNNNIIPGGATVSPVRSNTDGSAYTTTVTVTGNVNKVVIQVLAAAATTLPTLDQNNNPVQGAATLASDPDRLVVNIVRSAAPPLTLSEDEAISGTAPFTVTLTSTEAITLTSADIKVTGGFIPVNGISSDAAKKVWTVTITPGVGVAEVTVEAADKGAYIFPKGTFTVDTAGPVATITATPVGRGIYSITIAFNEPLQTGVTLLASEINVTGGTIDSPTPISGSNVYSAILTPNPGATTVTVQVNTGAVADAGGVQNAATPSPAHTFRVAATANPPETTARQGNVTISEIMFATDGGANDIQWIEISNSSKTETVALDADDGWEIIIENYNGRRTTDEPLSGTINFKDSDGVKTIPPWQTMLIVSANGRNSDRTHFVSTRVFKVYPELRDEFGMITQRNPFLNSTKGFHIKLVDGRNNLVDEVGNLDGNFRTIDEPAWALPKGWTRDGDRTSIIRRHRDYNSRSGRYSNQGKVHNGTLREGWIRAVETNFSYVMAENLETWYGSNSDYGSPGIWAGHVLPVQLSRFRPERTETGSIVIHWTTQSEMDNAGFNIMRSQTKTGEFKVINAQLIPGAGTKAESTTYTWTDTTAKPNVVYYYQIEDVSFAGERQTLATVRLRGFVSAKGKLTTQWGALKKSLD